VLRFHRVTGRRQRQQALIGSLLVIGLTSAIAEAVHAGQRQLVGGRLLMLERRCGSCGSV